MSNPFDYHTFMWGDRAAMAKCFCAVLDGPQAITMLVLDGPPGPDNDPTAWYVAADALADACVATGRRAVVVATLAECINEPFRGHLASRGLTALLGLSEALVALAAATKVGLVRADGHARVVEHHRSCTLDEAAAKARLREIGVAVPNGVVCTASAAAEAAATIGYPVTLKALGVAHKSEVGAVRVGLRDRASLDQALSEVPFAETAANAACLLVESTVTDIVAEVLVAVRRDPPIGWVVTLGFGGITTELWSDVVHLLAPVSHSDVIEALGQLRSAPLLSGYRGRPVADVVALADLVVGLVSAVSDSTTTCDIVEVELNPVLVGRSGATAVDALMIVDDAGPKRPSEEQP